MIGSQSQGNAEIEFCDYLDNDLEDVESDSSQSLSFNGSGESCEDENSENDSYVGIKIRK